MSDNTLGFLKKYEIFYDSSMIDNDLPYILAEGEKPIIELPTPAELDDWIYYGFSMFPTFEYQSGVKNASEYLDALTSTFDAIYKEGGYLNPLMHPQAEGKPARIAALEKFIRHVKRKPRVWITNPDSIAEFWLKHECN
jgi:peptidoglycan/xylan/chitin deacetylase (PgdA/CDA1 family)